MLLKQGLGAGAHKELWAVCNFGWLCWAFLEPFTSRCQWLGTPQLTMLHLGTALQVFTQAC